MTPGRLLSVAHSYRLKESNHLIHLLAIFQSRNSYQSLTLLPFVPLCVPRCAENSRAVEQVNRRPLWNQCPSVLIRGHPVRNSPQRHKDFVGKSKILSWCLSVPDRSGQALVVKESA